MLTRIHFLFCTLNKPRNNQLVKGTFGWTVGVAIQKTKSQRSFQILTKIHFFSVPSTKNPDNPTCRKFCGKSRAPSGSVEVCESSQAFVPCKKRPSETRLPMESPFFYFRSESTFTRGETCAHRRTDANLDDTSHFSGRFACVRGQTCRCSNWPHHFHCGGAQCPQCLGQMSASVRFISEANPATFHLQHCPTISCYMSV